MIETVVGVLICCALFIAALVLFYFFVIVFNGSKINSWLRKHRPEKFEDFEYIGNAGPGLMNPIKVNKYYYSDEDTENLEMAKLKSTYLKNSNILKYLIISLIFSFILLCLIGFFAK